MNYAHSNPMGSYPQHIPFISNMPQNHMWLLQQPKDSGYASDDYDLFDKAFQTHLAPAMEVNDSTDSSSMNVEMDEVPASTFSDSSSDASQSSPFQYADSLCTYNNNNQWSPYESLNMDVKKLSMDAGIGSMTGYCDIDSLLTSAYYDTCTTQDGRFQSFSTSNPSRQSMPVEPKTPVSQPKTISEEPESPETLARGRAHGRMPHTAVEQRYRQNLNDQFCKLRSAVPEIQTAQPARSGQPPKPSKAEVLMAATEYIRQLEEENQQLRDAMSQALDLRRKRVKTG